MYEGLKRAWLCDPDKNKECRKTGCFINGGPCRCTGNVSYRLESEKSDTYDRVANIIDELNDTGAADDRNIMFRRWTAHQNQKE